MTRFIRLLPVLLVFTLTTFSPVGSASAQNGPATAYSEVASCFTARGKLAVLALVDESKSLKSTDRDANRVDALVSMLRTLARYGSTGEGTPKKSIEVQLAGFGTSFAAGPWRELNPSTIGDLEGQAKGFAERDTANDTDFATALLGAQNEFVRKDAVSGTQPPCRLLLLFTDGMYELTTKNLERPYGGGASRTDLDAIVSRGKEFLCGPGQLTDQLREAGTAIVALGLASREQGFLQSIAERDAPGSHCGDSNSPPGKYVAVGGLEELRSAFDSAIAQALGGTPVPSPQPVTVCALASPADERCAQRFALDQSLREFHLLLKLGGPGIAVDVTPPKGNTVRLTADHRSPLTVGGAELTVSALTASDLVVDGRLPAAAPEWVGTWTVRFVDTGGTNPAAIAQSQLTVFGGLVPVIDPEAPEFQAGKRTDFRIRVTDTAGSPRTPADFVRSAKVSASLTDPQGKTEDIPVSPGAEGSYTAGFAMPDTTSSSVATLKVTLDVVTASGLRLQPRVVTRQVTVKPPSAYPTVTGALDLPPILDSGTTTGSLTITGGRGGKGCVWFTPRFTRIPPNTGAMATRFTPDATDPQRCVRVGPGQSTQVAVEVSPENVRSGVAQGEFTATLTADGESSRELNVPVRFQMDRPPDAVTQWALFVLIVVGGVLLPFVLLWLLNRWSARYLDPGQIRHAERDVEVTSIDVRDAATARPLREVLDVQSFSYLDGAPSERCKSFASGVLNFGRRIPVLPWALPHGTVRAGGAGVLTAAGGGRRKADWGRVGFDLGQTWVLVIDQVSPDTQGPLRGTLHLFVTDFHIGAKLGRLLEAVEREVPAEVRNSADRIQPRETGPIPDSEPEPEPFIPPK
ncbi:hypothetical protein [Amycolatopsis speibonae]|uniref:VWFA domain-containing protein n=1 Tax=Amycolatopsis speibonae TaxID=1450224 RepID=A0ABV7NPR4_9PSEU